MSGPTLFLLYRFRQKFRRQHKVPEVFQLRDQTQTKFIYCGTRAPPPLKAFLLVGRN